jgi:hypothetical protein
LYALPADARGFASRADLWARQVGATPFLQALLPFAPSLMPTVADAARNAARSDSALRPKLHQKVQFLATREFWRGVTTSPEWPAFMATYLRYRRATYAPGGEHFEGGALPDSLERIAERVLDRVRETPGAASFAIVGSQNQDYRGMFMDGEVGVLFTGAESLVPLIDLVFMVGTVTWVDDQATLDRLLPPVGELQRRIARITKDGVRPSAPCCSQPRCSPRWGRCSSGWSRPPAPVWRTDPERVRYSAWRPVASPTWDCAGPTTREPRRRE